MVASCPASLARTRTRTGSTALLPTVSLPVTVLYSTLQVLPDTRARVRARRVAFLPVALGLQLGRVHVVLRTRLEAVVRAAVAALATAAAADAEGRPVLQVADRVVEVDEKLLAESDEGEVAAEDALLGKLAQGLELLGDLLRLGRDEGVENLLRNRHPEAVLLLLQKRPHVGVALLEMLARHIRRVGGGGGGVRF